LPESKVRKTAADKRKRSSSNAAKSDKSDSAKSTKAAASRVSRIADDGTVTPSRKWLLPSVIVLAALGIAWGVFYFVNPSLIPFMESLGRWNILIAVAAVVVAGILFLALRPRTGTPYAPGGRRWVPPAFIAIGLFGVAWLIVYYVAGQDIGFMAALGNWNILIGMGGMAASFVIATLWK
jgi:hypothetical protein